MEKEQIKLARELAEKAHTGQVDKAQKPYIEHLAAVAAGVPDVLKPAAWLHDILEDTDTKPKDLKAAGIQETTIETVITLTHVRGETHKEYIRRISEDANAVTIKLADLKHNTDLSRIKDPGPKDRKRQAKYLKAIEFLQKGK